MVLFVAERFNRSNRLLLTVAQGLHLGRRDFLSDHCGVSSAFSAVKLFLTAKHAERLQKKNHRNPVKY
jgi:hypothetical protein